MSTEADDRMKGALLPGDIRRPGPGQVHFLFKHHGKKKVYLHAILMDVFCLNIPSLSISLRQVAFHMYHTFSSVSNPFAECCCNGAVL